MIVSVFSSMPRPGCPLLPNPSAEGFSVSNMAKACIFLDESGDMGWSLDRPRGRGGFSQYLVLAAIIVPADMNKFLERPVRNLYVRRGRSLGRELKSTALNGHERESFGRALAALPAKHAGLSLHAIVTEKCKVPSSLRGKPDVLYNHMAEQMLHQQICRWREVDIYPDARTLRRETATACTTISKHVSRSPAMMSS